MCSRMSFLIATYRPQLIRALSSPVPMSTVKIILEDDFNESGLTNRDFVLLVAEYPIPVLPKARGLTFSPPMGPKQI